MERLHQVSCALQRHLCNFATILIAPAANSSMLIRNALDRDNTRRREAIKRGEPDPGRSDTIDWVKVRIGFRCCLGTH